MPFLSAGAVLPKFRCYRPTRTVDTGFLVSRVSGGFDLRDGRRRRGRVAHVAGVLQVVGKASRDTR